MPAGASRRSALPQWRQGAFQNRQSRRMVAAQGPSGRKESPMTAPTNPQAASIDLAAIKAAAQTLKGSIVETPFAPSRTLSAMLGCEIWLKFENLQFTGAYKERGALNKLSSLS